MRGLARMARAMLRAGAGLLDAALADDGVVYVGEVRLRASLKRWIGSPRNCAAFKGLLSDLSDEYREQPV